MSDLQKAEAYLLPAASESGAIIEAIRDFFIVELRNDDTRRTYFGAIRRLADWCNHRGISIESISPRDISLFREEDSRRSRSVNTGLSAIRTFFDYLCERGLIASNPAARVKNERITVDEPATPALTMEEVKILLNSIPQERLIDLRDRAVVGLLHYALPRTGAVIRLDKGDYFTHGLRRMLRLREKRGHEFFAPVPDELALLLDQYLSVAGIEYDSDPLIQSCFQGGRRLTGQRLQAQNLTDMLQRRAAAAGLQGAISPRVFRGSSITNFLDSGGRLEEAQQLARHKHIWTTQVYDRRKNKRAYNELWRLSLDGEKK